MSSNKTETHRSVLADILQARIDTTYVSLKTVQDLLSEVKRGVDLYGVYTSNAEARLVIERESQELWDEIETGDIDEQKIYNEALQVAATALRYAEEVRWRIDGRQDGSK